MNALRLHAITLADASAANDSSEATATSEHAVIIPFRELCAVVSEQKAFTADEPTPESIQRHRAIVDAAFKRTAVLPAPVGVVFRTPDVLKAWMELHYVSLTGALQFVDDRAVARVHVTRADGKRDDFEPGSDHYAIATESFRAVRRHAVAALPLRGEQGAASAFSAAFLVECDLWKEFLAAVREQHDAHEALTFDVTGPWAPYDFVRMQFGV